MHSILGQRQARTQAATFLLPEAPDVHLCEHILEHHLRVAQTCQRAMHRARTKKNDGQEQPYMLESQHITYYLRRGVGPQIGDVFS